MKKLPFCQRFFLNIYFCSIGALSLKKVEGFPGDSGGKESAYRAGDLGLILGSGRSPGEGNGNPLQYSCLGNPMDRGAQWAPVRGVAKSLTQNFLLYAATWKLAWMEVRDITQVTRNLVFPFLSFLSRGLVTIFSNSSQFSSVTQLCPILCDPMDCSMPGLPVHHQLPELVEIHVHRVSHAIQPSHPLLSPSPPAFNLSQHQGLFQ